MPESQKQAPLELHGMRVWVAGHGGLVGSALLKRLSRENISFLTATRAELDLTRQTCVEEWMQDMRPDIVILAAAKVGGITANRDYPAEFIYENLAIAQNVIHQSWKQGVKKLVFMGSSCIYPKFAPQPISENALLTGSLESTNEAYAIAKIAGLKMCEFYRTQYGCDFIGIMPCNLYGTGDRWDDPGAHVIPGLLARFHMAKISREKSVSVWGSGKPLREFLYSDDLAEAVLCALRYYSHSSLLNVGSGEEISISELAKLIAQTTGYCGSIVFDPAQPDGTPRKILDSHRIRTLGWSPQTSLQEGLRLAYADYCTEAESRSDNMRRIIA